MICSAWTPRTQSSGFNSRRWARAAVAMALTSSGKTKSRSSDHGMRSGELVQGEGAARRDAHLHLRMLACGRGQADDVALDRFIGVHLLNGILDLQ